MQTLEYLHPPRSGRGHTPRRFLLALVLTLTTLLGVVASQTPKAYASSLGSTGPIIHWDQSMIYPGQNNGNPEGPVGETAVVHGQGFTAGQQLKLMIVPGDSDTTVTACQNPTYSTTVAQATATASGSFDATFAWPAEVGQSKPYTEYSICALSATDNSVVSSQDDGPFTVLTANKPTFSLSTASAAAGSTIKVTGQNWVPAQSLNITIASCADCDPGSNNIAGATTTSIGRNSGTFSVNIPIPATMAPNNYVVNVTSQTGPLDAYHIDGLGVKQIAVTAAVATPTPTVVASPSATVTSTQTAATTPTTGTTTPTTTGSTNGSGNGLLMIILIVVAVLLLIAGGIIFFLLAQRKKQTPGTNGPSSGPPTTPPGPFSANQASPFNAQYTPMTPFPQGQPVNTPNSFGAIPNPNSAYPGYNQQNQPWQSNSQSNWQANPQSNAGFNNFQQNQPFQPQQGNFMPGTDMGRPSFNRQCMRCGSPLAPNSPICGACGTRNPPAADPNDPTVAY